MADRLLAAVPAAVKLYACKLCRGRKPPAEFGPPNKAARIAKAEAEGRMFVPGTGNRLRGLPSQVAEATWRRIEGDNARQAWEWWLEWAPAGWLAARSAWLDGRPAEHWRERYRSDPAFRAGEIAKVAARKKRRGRFDEHVRKVIRGKTNDRKMRLLIGYGRAELLAHLRSRFRDGMTVAALMAGEIHIDHDEPVSWCDPRNPADLRQLWRLENVQPLWAMENVRKGARTMAEWLGEPESKIAA